MLTIQSVQDWMVKANEYMQENKAYLTELDQAIGDSDHGINMSRGFQEVVKKLEQSSYDDVSAMLKDVAMTLMSKVGGASGPLYGTAFLKLSMAVKGKETVDKDDIAAGLDAAAQGVQQRGKSTTGEKTMVDVWAPIVTWWKEQDEIDAADLEKKAKEAMESTKPMKATKGRASYLKEKSVGHIDPGAASSYYIFKSLAEILA
ncbi:dihydroxyacetone kinase subunit DhaL [Oceanobacillus neutriphilus]|uniref:PTS-dependent dihydroxyacetone kinase, ADP-binding subunit DhaL n=1 Tax=Oceanobacillus neutriphilus TaxID=531815 RepID=A0ABQ2NM43_9BACI|nr:dihydroxyacetone kinase subunit DhaL [Oceanobacillus neutriphilus]GGP06888.1 PTS-dependent dihydroxyacetone kinase, ADP-binding subunit DhaL [Oceanobacillus neutriphilus]